jgi:hypothetical protein
MQRNKLILSVCIDNDLQMSSPSCVIGMQNDLLISAPKPVPSESSQETDIVNSNPHMNDFESKFEVFTKWLLDNGAKLPKLSFKDGNVHVMSSIDKNEVCMSIPSSLVISLKSYEDSTIIKQLTSETLVNNAKVQLAIYLLELKYTQHCFWKPFIDVLPTSTDCSNMPAYFGEKELAYLSGSSLIEKIAVLKTGLMIEYTDICKDAPDFARYPFKEYLWARMIICTKTQCFNIGTTAYVGLIPVVGMLKHTTEYQISVSYDTHTSTIISSSLKGINNGQLLSVTCKNTYCNSAWLINYGYVFNTNPHNRCVITLDIDERKISKIKRLLLCNNNNVMKTVSITTHYNNTFTAAMFSNLRIIYAHESELTNTISVYNKNVAANIHQPLHVELVSASTELKVLNVIYASTKACLNKFDTSLKDDVTLLSKDDVASDANKLSTNVRNCIIVRMGEKAILEYWLNLSNACILALRGNPTLMKQELYSDTVYVRCLMNRLLNIHETSKIFVKQSNIPESGKGLFASQLIKAGDTIAEFNGLIRPSGMTCHSSRSLIGFSDGSVLECFPTCPASFCNDTIIFPTESRQLYKALESETPFYNVHGTRNAYIEIDDIDHRIYLKAYIDINQDTEIFCHYGLSYWFNVEFTRGFLQEDKMETLGFPDRLFEYPGILNYMKLVYPGFQNISVISETSTGYVLSLNFKNGKGIAMTLKKYSLGLVKVTV